MDDGRRREWRREDDEEASIVLRDSSRDDSPSRLRKWPKAMVEYIRLGQSIYRTRLESDRMAGAGRATAGRNEPCTCGSGRKYKKCCGAPT